VVGAVGHIEVGGVGTIRRHPVGEREVGPGGPGAVTGEPEPTGAGHGGDDAPAVDAADAGVVGIGDVEVAGPVDRHAGGEAEEGGGGRAAVPAETGLAGAGHRGGGAVTEIDPAHHVVEGVGHEEERGGDARSVATPKG